MESTNKPKEAQFQMEIALTNITKSIKGITVVNNVSMHIHSGNITGFQGINGSGKTMLMRLIAGLIKPSCGEIQINCKVLGNKFSFPQSIGLLIENPAFLDQYSAFDNLKFLADIKQKISDDDIIDILNDVSLDPFSRKKYKTFSLGMKQRLGIAAAFMESPDIILLDEPTNALDSNGILMVKNLLIKARTRDAIIILTCHDFNILEELSDVIYVMEEGKVVA